MIEGINDIPDSLRSTYNLIKCAFPKDIPDKYYLPLLLLLYENMSMRGVSEIVSVFTKVDYPIIYNDVARALTEEINTKYLEEVRALLVNCGYEEWLKED